MLSVKNLFFEYPNKIALNDVSFDISAGSITALVGPNGAGKTTLMRCIAGLETPYSGEVKLGEIDVINNPKLAHAEIGYLSDFFGVYEDLSIEKCLTFSANIRGIPADKTPARITEVAAMLGLADRMKEQAGGLSRGLRQRLGIAQAIIHSPKLLILDEPASGLDPEARINLSHLMLDLKKLGMTIIVSSHILSELEDYSDEMIVIKESKLIGRESLDQPDKAATRIISVKYLGDKNHSPEFANCKIISSKQNELEIEFSGSEKEQAELLAYLIKQKIEVVEFLVREKKMQDFYIDLAFKEKGNA